MAETVEYRILEDVRATLAGITTAGGYQTTVRRVHDMDGKEPTDATERPALVVRKLDTKKSTGHASEESAGPVGVVRCEMPLLVYCVVDKNATWRRDVERLAADVERALLSTYWRGESAGQVNAFDTTVEGSQITNDFPGINVAMARVDVLVKFGHPFSDPTTSAF